MIVDLVAFAAAVGVILTVGPRMAQVAQGLAIVTGWGGALFGVIFLSIATDLPEIALTPAAVLAGHPTLAIGTLLGSTAAQVLTIAVADLLYRGGKVMNAAPSGSAIGQSALLIGVLSVPLVGAPLGLTLGWLSIATPFLALAYLAGLSATRGLGGHVESEEEDHDEDARSLWLRFVLYAGLLAAAGIALERTTSTISDQIGLSPTAGGALLAGVASSLPEYVTVTAAVRRGAIALAVGDAIGSSAFDVFLLGWADAFYKDGSLFRLLGPQEVSLIGLSLILTMLALFGFVRRTSPRRSGSTESYLMVAVYIGVALLLVMTG